MWWIWWYNWNIFPFFCVVGVCPSCLFSTLSPPGFGSFDYPLELIGLWLLFLPSCKIFFRITAILLKCHLCLISMKNDIHLVELEVEETTINQSFVVQIGLSGFQRLKFWFSESVCPFIFSMPYDISSVTSQISMKLEHISESHYRIKPFDFVFILIIRLHIPIATTFVQNKMWLSILPKVPVFPRIMLEHKQNNTRV